MSKRQGLTRAGLTGIAPYRPDESGASVDLSDNTNRWGAPPAAVRELRDATTSLARYPDCYSAPLRAILADYIGVDEANVIVGAGSDNVLDAAIRAFGDHGDTLSFARPSFPMVAAFARMNGLRVVSTPFAANGDVDIDALLTDDPAIAYVCSPNNPTGLPIPRPTLERIVDRANGVVIIDEAYAEFAGTSVVDLVAQSPRLLVARTLSKAWGLAGLRVGYGIAQPSLLAEIEKSRGPFTVSQPSERAAAAAVAEDRAWLREQTAAAVASRGRFLDALRSRGYAPLDSAANFVLLPLADAVRAAGTLRSHGIAVRVLESLDMQGDAIRHAGGNALRISIGPWSEMEAVLGGLDAWKAKCA
jgi:histidinol-phosphate aminotransferase